ncbi:MAG: SPFH domain-containing protein [Bacteroidaceae bacterium]|nr:SPFH domain-containing protein [Bacteroidaceae bacterium]
MNEKEFSFAGTKLNGFAMLFANLALTIASIGLIVWGISETMWISIVAGVLTLVLTFFLWPGFIMLEPNEAMVMLFFGKYKGTFKETGYFWVNPFLSTKKLSMRARNLNAEPIKVNDKVGNPVLIGLVLVWKLKDSYKAMFEIDSQTMAANSTGGTTVGTSVASRMNAFEDFVKVQSDAALRQVAGLYAYDDTDNNSNELTLRSGGDEVNDQLVQKLNERLAIAGMEVVEARINYLAYAPEIAAVMLRRQQAGAIIMAREKIVEGAVSMVKMALDKLSAEEIVELDEEKKAAMVSNLLVVLCADESAQPVVNTGTLNH